MKKSMGKKEIGKVYLNELSESELREAKKLIPLLEPETKRYAREEIFEAILMEGHSKKVAKAVISALYQN